MNFILGALLPVRQDLCPLSSFQLPPLYQLPFSANKLASVLLFQTSLGLRPLSSQPGPSIRNPQSCSPWRLGIPPLGTLGFHEEICPPGNGLHILGTLLCCPFPAFRLCGAAFCVQDCLFCGGLLQHPRPALRGHFALHSCSPWGGLFVPAISLPGSTSL